MTPLTASGKPLFFPVEPSDTASWPTPENRLGDAIRTSVRSLSLMQKEALVTSARTGATWRLSSDEGAYLDGDDEAPCPLSFLTTGMISSYMNEILALAQQRNIEISNIRLIQDNYYTMRGSALKGTMTGGAKDVQLEAVIDSPSDPGTLAQLVIDATAASPLNGLLQKALESLFLLQHNGTPIDCKGVGQISPAVAVESTDDALFDAAQPQAGNWNELIERKGMTPITEETTGFAGSSLTEHQDRTLHIRGICTLRDDGVKMIEQQLFNPHGSIFHFLSDEAGEGAGAGRAPDAASYISAGIAFCFMTQFGRYAKIVKKPLADYRIVQDTHFSRGGASAGTGKQPGSAAPVETHVSLVSDHDDEFAQDVLAMSEQTCFLHALCRLALKTRVRVSS